MFEPFRRYSTDKPCTHGQTDRQTDGHTKTQTPWFQYTPHNFITGGIIRVVQQSLKQKWMYFWDRCGYLQPAWIPHDSCSGRSEEWARRSHHTWPLLSGTGCWLKKTLQLLQWGLNSTFTIQLSYRMLWHFCCYNSSPTAIHSEVTLCS